MPHMRAFVIIVVLISALLLGRTAQTCYDGGMLIDNGDPEYSEGGAWEKVTGNYYTAGQSWTDARRTTAEGAWAQWTPNLPAAGRYRVYLWAIPCRDSAAVIEIAGEGKPVTLTRDMRYGHLGWTDLGEYRFAAGAAGHVKITRGNNTLFADAVKFVPAARVRPPEPLPPYPAPNGSTPRLDARGNLLLSGKPYLVLYQQTLEDTADTPEDISRLDEIFDIALAQRVNTLGVTLHWNDFETAEGVYDYRVIDAVIEKARARHMHVSLVLFWGWRNLNSYYVPAYITQDPQQYLRCHDRGGVPAQQYRVSPFSDATRQAESRALSALLARVKAKDPRHQVVILAQIENEMPCFRDYSAPAMQAWQAGVPAELMTYLTAHQGEISLWMADHWSRSNFKTAGGWGEVFGDEESGGRVFAAWYMGKYIESLVSEAKKVLDIPMYCNAWLYESPCTGSFMDIFHAAAPSVDAMGPDAYGSEARWESEASLAMRPWNRMVIPEQHYSVKMLWRALADYNVLLSGSYYDVEGLDWLKSRETYDLVTAMSPLICARRGVGDMRGFYQSTQNAGESWEEPFRDFMITYTATTDNHTWAQFNPKIPAPCEEINNISGGELDGCGMIMKLADNDYLLTSTRINLTLRYLGGGDIGIAGAERGHFANGIWVKDGKAAVQDAGDALTVTFPTANRVYGQVRLKLATRPAHLVQLYQCEDGTLRNGAVRLCDGVTSYAGNCSNRWNRSVIIATTGKTEASGMSIRYSAEGRCRMSLYCNGEHMQDVDFPDTGKWTTWSILDLKLPIPAGAALTFQIDNGDRGANLDYLLVRE